jgi:hypothetical protein
VSKYESEADRKARKERAELEQFRQETLAEDVKRLFELDEFQRVMSELLSFGGIFQSAMTGNSFTHYNIGKSDLAKQQFTFLAKADKDAAFELLRRQTVVKD